MDYLGYAKIIILPYDSIDIHTRNEINDLNIDLDEESKKLLNIKTISFLKKDQFLEPLNNPLKALTDQTLYISQNSLSDTLKNFEKGKACVMFMTGEYNIENENINIECLKFIMLNIIKNENINVECSNTLNDNHPIININGNVLFNCKYLSVKELSFNINKSKENYFNDQHFTYAGLIFTKKLDKVSFIDCNFNNDKNSNYVKIFNIKEGAKEINIIDCIFTNSNFEIQNTEVSIITDNKFVSTDIAIRYSNAMFHKNVFNGLFRLSMFNSYLTNINNNIFNDIDSHSYFIDADHNSKLYLTNNKITTFNKNFSLININRYSKCYVDNNDIEIKNNQILSSVTFNGELYISNNRFNKNDIEIAGYDCNIFIEKNNELKDSNEELKFFLSERGIIKPTNTYFSIC
jgi:hypothetical protein